MIHYDAIVAGGGPAGCAFAITLAMAGRSVAVLDRGSPLGLRSVDVVPPEVRPVLVELGVWERFCSDGHLRTPGVLSAWGQAVPAAHDHILSCFGDGWHVSRRRFAEMLRTQAAAAGAEVLNATSVDRLAANPHRDGGWCVQAMADSGRIALDADYLIEATGRAASLTRQPLVAAVTYDRLVAVLAKVESSQDVRLEHRLLLEAAETGWWYSASTPDAGLLVAWMTSIAARDKDRKRLRDRWPRELERAPYTRLRIPDRATPPVGVVAAKSWLRRAALDRWLAVGDTAAAYDPLSGQGVVRALRTGQLAAASVMADQDGANGAINRYADQVTEGFRHYLRVRRTFYRKEQRWPDSPFWQLRQTAADELLMAE